MSGFPPYIQCSHKTGNSGSSGFRRHTQAKAILGTQLAPRIFAFILSSMSLCFLQLCHFSTAFKNIIFHGIQYFRCFHGQGPSGHSVCHPARNRRLASDAQKSHLLTCSDPRQVDSEGNNLHSEQKAIPAPACSFLSIFTYLRSLTGNLIYGSISFSSSLQSHLYTTSLHTPWLLFCISGGSVKGLFLDCIGISKVSGLLNIT